MLVHNRRATLALPRIFDAQKRLSLALRRSFRGGGGGDSGTIEYHCCKILVGRFRMSCFSSLPPARHFEALVRYILSKY